MLEIFYSTQLFDCFNLCVASSTIFGAIIPSRYLRRYVQSVQLRRTGGSMYILKYLPVKRIKE